MVVVSFLNLRLCLVFTFGVLLQFTIVVLQYPPESINYNAIVVGSFYV